MNEHKIIEVENEKSDSEDHLIIESVNKFLEKDVKPYVKEFESQDKYPQDIANKMADLGLFGATISPEYGGLGLSAVTYSKIVENVSAVWMSVSGIFNSHLIMCAAVAAKCGGLKWDDYKNHLNNSDTLALCNKIKVNPDKDAEKCCPEFMSAKVKMVVKGKTYEKFVKIPKGEPENFMKDEEFISKFRGLTEPYLSNERVNQLTDLMLKIDQANNVNSIFEYSQIDL